MITTRVAARINNEGPYPADLLIEHDVQTIPSSGRTVPNFTWSHVDKAGHYHAYLADGSLPTLKEIRKRVPCTGACGDGECSGSYRTVYRCGLCRRKVVPGTKTSYADHIVHGPANYTLIVREVPTTSNLDEPVSVVIEADTVEQRTAFGFGHLDSLVVDSTTGVTASFRLDRFGWGAR